VLFALTGPASFSKDFGKSGRCNGRVRLDAVGVTGTKGTVEGARSLDINRLNRAGCLRPGYPGGWQWTRDGKRIAAIVVRAAQSRSANG
jgi:hypothetical protein